jgi:acyl-CoA reductase-like NAD-dependent aldehyde dehydrogenase
MPVVDRSGLARFDDSVSDHLSVVKTHKLFINGGFPRSESGRSLPVHDVRGQVAAHVSQASRKDLRDAVEAARAAQPAWAAMTAYNRGQVLYRMAEMLEGARTEMIDALQLATLPPSPASTGSRSPALRRGPKDAARELDASIDRLICFAGWADKHAQVLGCQTSVAGPYYNFTTPEPMGVVAIIAPARPALLGLVSLIAPALCSGNAVVALASAAHPVTGAVLGELGATSDVPPGVLNLLTGRLDDLVQPMAEHRDINAIAAAGVDDETARVLWLGCADNLKRVRIVAHRDAAWLDPAICESPGTIEPFVEMKTIWHPMAM